MDFYVILYELVEAHLQTNNNGDDDEINLIGRRVHKVRNDDKN